MKILASVASLAFMVSVFSPKAEASPITYDLLPFTTSDGASVTGWIMTDGTIGAINTLDLVSWSWTISSRAGSFTSVDDFQGQSINAHATDTGLYLDFAPPFDPVQKPDTGHVGDSIDLQSRTIFGATPPLAFTEFEFFAVTWNDQQLPYWAEAYPDISGHSPTLVYPPPYGVFHADATPFLIAIAAPEPSSMILAAVGLTALLAYRWRK